MKNKLTPAQIIAIEKMRGDSRIVLRGSLRITQPDHEYTYGWLKRGTFNALVKMGVLGIYGGHDGQYILNPLKP